MNTIPFPAEKVAALFVEYDGVYFRRSDVIPAGYAIGNDQDGTTRVIKDAKSYDGPWPIIAHPPCISWGSFATTLRLKRGFKIGGDDGCFKCALETVRRWGGVIEHPANSRAWNFFSLKKPRKYHITSLDSYEGFSIFLNQSHYGHKAQKPTWLYICGYRGDFEEDFYIPQSKGRVSHQIANWRNMRHPFLPDHLRKKTPELFADLLVSIAKRCTFYRDHWSYHIPR